VISRFLKNEMDKRGNGWNCVVGRNFGGHVIHQTKKYVFFQVRELSVLLWKA
jgi:dynein light chain LC8-type